jgi:hypothetical protein
MRRRKKQFTAKQSLSNVGLTVNQSVIFVQTKEQKECGMRRKTFAGI